MLRTNNISFSKLQDALQDLKTLEDQGGVAGFLNNVKDAEALTGLAEDVRTAMVDYQVCPLTTFDRSVSKLVPKTALQQDIYLKNHQLIVSSTRR